MTTSSRSLMMVLCILMSASALAQTDRDVLISLYQATNGDNWEDSSGWKAEPLGEDGFNTDPCSDPIWFGLTCEEGRVTELALDRNGLSGNLPTDWSGLSEIRSIRFPNGDLTGEIPDLSGLLHLETIDFKVNALSGPIPPLHDLPALSTLFLSNNQLTGEIPSELGNLAKLQLLQLNGNLLEGSVPPGLFSPFLQVLLLRNNRLTGTIPVPESPTFLMTLDLSENRLTGTIPAELATRISPVQLILNSNRLQGPIPPEIGDLSDLWELNLAGNQLSGTIPATLGDLSRLSILDLSGNRFVGPLPMELVNPPDLKYLYLAQNQFEGPIPPFLGDMTQLEELDLQANRFEGNIPVELANLSEIRYLNLSTNRLTGPIPLELAGLSNLSALYLHGNDLSGTIPAELGQLPAINRLYLSGNRLEGEVPASLAELPQGTRLDLRDNRLQAVEQGLDDELGLRQIGEARWDSLQKVVAVYPQLALGGGFEVVLSVSNRSPLAWSGTAYLDGGVWPAQRAWELNGADMTGMSSFPIELDPFGSGQFILSSAGSAVAGWLSLRAEGDSLPEEAAAAFFYKLSDASGLVDSTGVGPAELGLSFFFPVEQSTTGKTVLTGIAIRSVSDLFALTLQDLQGETVQTVAIHTDQAFLLGEVFDQIPADFVGSVTASAYGPLFAGRYPSVPFYLTVLRVDVTENNGVQLTSIPATRVP